MSNENIVLVETNDKVCVITLNRPDKLNSFSDELTFQLQDALKEASKDSKAHVVIITGAGRGFCAGQDLQSRSISAEAGQRPQLGDSIKRRYNPIIVAIRRMEKPVIAAVNGVAAGAGASLALACDFRVVADNASFIQSFTKVGLIPDSGSTFLLPRLIGFTKALELMFTTDKLEAKEALELGLVNKLVPQDQVMKTALDFAGQLAKGPLKAFGLTKRAVNRAVFWDLEELLEYEASLQEIAGRSDDFQEGVKAFIEKRQPVYSGR
ncbi:MAG: enoyl-CoA hydratase/isomerase family protein [Candidatus Melainabacteria bacterium]|nr:enoyl-CoA hydratase/isomerase family protein [Candidatus Melainabacteria bacterium]